MALTDFIVGGHYARHLRRMRAAYGERLQVLADSVEKLCSGVLRLRPVQSGLHAVADLDGVDEERVYEEARQRGIEVAPLGTYFIGPRTANGLLLGFASTGPDTLHRGVERLAASLEAARKWPHRSTRSGPSQGRRLREQSR
jgi:GntR family transcriptional regulator/MocR family aminotransferase